MAGWEAEYYLAREKVNLEKFQEFLDIPDRGATVSAPLEVKRSVGVKGPVKKLYKCKDGRFYLNESAALVLSGPGKKSPGYEEIRKNVTRYFEPVSEGEFMDAEDESWELVRQPVG